MYFKFRLFTYIIAAVIGFFAFTNSAKAEIAIEIARDFTINNNGQMQVGEVHTLHNKFTDRFVPGGTTRSYEFVISAETNEERAKVAEQIYNSLAIKLNGSRINYTRSKETRGQGDIYGATYQLRTRLNPNSIQKVEINYTHPELGSRVGGLLDAYIPAFAEGSSFEVENTKYTFRTTLKIPSNSGDESVVSVTPVSKFKEGAYDVYVFDQESLVGKFVWVQRGSQQVYKFKITQEIQPTQDRASGNLNEYQVVLPRDVDEVNVTQKVYYEKITPEPYAINTDAEGNMLGIFRLPAEQATTITLEGYALLTSHKEDIKNSGKISDVDNTGLNKARYTAPAEYWEVAAGAINSTAESVVKTDEIYTALTELYEYVVNKIDYSQVKRFGLNERQGALATLQGGAAVCMEYSDLYLTLLRNRGIPARAAFGYGYDSRVDSESQEAHQWVQVYLPEFKEWISIDVTWGETGPKLIGGDLNHFYTHVAAEDPNTPAVLSRLAFGVAAQELSGPKFSITAQAELPSSTENMLTVAELQEKYPSISTSDGNFLWAALQQKFLTTLQNLFKSPGNIDFQGWLLVIIVAGVALLLLSTVVTLIRKSMYSKRNRRRISAIVPESSINIVNN